VEPVFQVLRAFLMGVLEKRVFLGGFLMVNSWWNAWLLWSIKLVCARDEKHATFSNLFFAFCLS
jgi:hypothetical protein